MADEYCDYNEDDFIDIYEDEYESDYDDYYSDDDILENYDIYNSNDLIIKKPAVIWLDAKINNIDISISSEGRILFKDDLFHSTDGQKLEGTPYKYIKIGNKKYLIHELVWTIFNGDVPTGWDIRHKEEYIQNRKRKVYSNHLSNLTIYKMSISEPIFD
jgi:hypothetical protein